MKTPFLLICFSLAFFTDLNGQVVQNPVDDFLSHMTRVAKDEMYKVTAPNRSGGTEVFLTYSSWFDGRAGHDWVVYAPVSGGYQRLNNPITFKKSALAVGNFKELGGTGMLTYAPDAGGKGALIGYVFNGADVQQINLGMIEFSGKDKGLTDKYFTENKRPTVEVTAANKLPKMIH